MLAGDLDHQPPAAVQVAQAGKDRRVDLAAETAVLGLGVQLQERRMPTQQTVAAGQGSGQQPSQPREGISMRYRLKYVTPMDAFSTTRLVTRSGPHTDTGIHTLSLDLPVVNLSVCETRCRGGV